MAAMAVVFFPLRRDWSQINSTSKARGFCRPSFIISWKLPRLSFSPLIPSSMYSL